MKYVIDELLTRLRNAWMGLSVSAEDYAFALKAAGKRPIHHNTLRKLETPNPQFSVTINRDLENVLLVDPLDTSSIRRRSKRRKLATVRNTPSTDDAIFGAAVH